MSWIQFVKNIYTPETLDTRCVIPSSAPPVEALAERDDPNFKPTPTKDAKPPKWKTPEFIFYAIMFAIIFPLMVKTPMGVSNSSHPSYPKYEHLLSDGWIPGRKADLSDAQYNSFRDNLGYLFILLVAHPLLRKLYDYFSGSHLYTKTNPHPQRVGGLSQGLSPSASADARLEQRISFDFSFAIVFLIALHGFSALKVLFILYINFKLAKSLPSNRIPAATWIFNIGVLFANEFCRGYPYASISRTLGFENTKGDWGAWLDDHSGLISRWEVLFNITILRMISFNMDHYWNLNSGGSSPLEKKQLDPANLSVRERVNIPAKSDDFTFRKYIAYILYAPLYLTGPIITFNDFISQLRYKSPTVTLQRTLMYAIRFGVVLLTMELMIHYIYAVAIAKSNPDWEIYSPFQLSMLGYFNLHHIWLKLLIPWRFFRLWALLDDMDPPENMTRCMSNNYSALAFWRGWHRSFNRWVVRYVYVPLKIGASRQSGIKNVVVQFGTYLLVFMFVAVWHDINLRLLMWGWLVVLFLLPEIAATLAFPARKWRDRPEAYRRLCGVGAIGNILMMMIANLVGYAIGVDGLKGLVHGIIGSTAGVAVFAAACGCLFIGVQIMFEVREEEKRAGITMPN